MVTHQIHMRTIANTLSNQVHNLYNYSEILKNYIINARC